MGGSGRVVGDLAVGVTVAGNLPYDETDRLGLARIGIFFLEAANCCDAEKGAEKKFTVSNHHSSLLFVQFL